jgi:hypothetical protein
VSRLNEPPYISAWPSLERGAGVTVQRWCKPFVGEGRYARNISALVQAVRWSGWVGAQQFSVGASRSLERVGMRATVQRWCKPFVGEGGYARNSSALVQAVRLTLGFARWRSPQAITRGDPHVRGGLSYRNSMNLPGDPFDALWAPSKWHSCSKDPHERGGRPLL